MIVAGVFTFLIAPIFIKLLRFFPPVVTGTLITIIGLCLVPVGALDAVTNPHTHETDPTNIRWFLYALGTIAIIVAIQRLFRGFLATIAVLLGLVIGCAVAYALGDMNFDQGRRGSAFGFTPPFLFGMPKFDFVACLTMIIVLLITAVESTGSTIATGEIVGKRVKASDIGNVLRADGVATAIGGIFNSFPYTAFSENVGLVRLTGVKSRWVVAAAGVIMIILGLPAEGGRDRRVDPQPRARRRGADAVRHRGRRRHPDAGQGRLHRPPQPDHRHHQPGAGAVGDVVSRHRQGHADRSGPDLRQRHQHRRRRRDPAQHRVLPHRFARPAGGRRRLDHRSTRSTR